MKHTHNVNRSYTITKPNVIISYNEQQQGTTIQVLTNARVSLMISTIVIQVLHLKKQFTYTGLLTPTELCTLKLSKITLYNSVALF